MSIIKNSAYLNTHAPAESVVLNDPVFVLVPDVVIICDPSIHQSIKSISQILRFHFYKQSFALKNPIFLLSNYILALHLEKIVTEMQL